jgi:hypothetical protein
MDIMCTLSDGFRFVEARFRGPLRTGIRASVEDQSTRLASLALDNETSSYLSIEWAVDKTQQSRIWLIVYTYVLIDCS